MGNHYRHFYGKRSADAEADASAFYGRYGHGHHLGYGHGHHGYPGHPYNGYHYGHYYGKRSADAEPAADPHYAHVGHGRGTYGHLVYGHHTWPWPSWSPELPLSLPWISPLIYCYLLRVEDSAV